MEDLSGTIRCNVWPRTFVDYREQIKDESVVGLIGSIDKRGGEDDEANFTINEMIPIEELPKRMIREMRIRFEERKLGGSGLQMLYELLRGSPGHSQICLVMDLANGMRVSGPCGRLQVELTPEVRQQVEDLVGSQNVRYIRNEVKQQEYTKSRRWSKRGEE